MAFELQPSFWAAASLLGSLLAITVSDLATRKYRPVPRFLSEAVILLGRTMFIRTASMHSGSEPALWSILTGASLSILGISLTAAALLRYPLHGERAGWLERSAERVWDTIPNTYIIGNAVWVLGAAVWLQSFAGALWIPVWTMVSILQASVERSRLPLLPFGRSAATNRYQSVPGIRNTPFAPWPFENLVFKGGGVRGLAYLGALRVLDLPEINILNQIERVAGASAGAITAVLLSFRLPLEGMITLFHTFDYAQFTSRRDLDEPRWSPGFLEKEIAGVRTNLDNVQRLVSHYGWYSSEPFFEWLKDTIADQYGGNGMATFSDFKSRGFRDLYIAVSNVSQARSTICSAETTPTMAVAKAVRMSMSIPLLFEGITGHDGDIYVDGGVLDNYPIHVFDNPIYGVNNPYFLGGVNWRTLGCFLYTPQGCDEGRKTITGLVSYLERLFETMLNIQDETYSNNPINRLRTIEISDCCVDSIDFHIAPGSEAYEELLESGRYAAQSFLDSFPMARGSIE
ncbi:MAG: patatin-like phospholipase family protein [Anaerolineales bacterium]|nr:patatin-like phospholipase family protein [Anaerolineales bacterium]